MTRLIFISNKYNNSQYNKQILGNAVMFSCKYLQTKTNVIHKLIY